jgi:hypothetical protein
VTRQPRNLQNDSRSAVRLDEWEQVPTVKGGRFVPPDDARGLAEWGPGYIEHLLQHPELVLLWEPAQRTFHIGCTRHAAARSCLESGGVPKGFACPVGSASCPLLPLKGARLTAPSTGPDRSRPNTAHGGHATLVLQRTAH